MVVNRVKLRLMTQTPQSASASASASKSALLAGLQRFKLQASAGSVRHAKGLFSYCALTRERLIAVNLPAPILGIVLSGTKEIWRGMNSCTLRPGTLFVLPAGEPMDILNIPDEVRGIYQSMIVELADIEPILDPLPRSGAAANGQDFEISLTPHIVGAVVHAASELADGPARPVLRRSRLSELLVLLQDQRAAAPLFRMSITQRVLKVVGADLARDWKAPEVSRAIGMSQATLRRKLSQEGQSFARLLRTERMLAASRLLAAHEQSQFAAALVGYASRAHFARHFKRQFGSNPHEFRRHAMLENNARP